MDDIKNQIIEFWENNATAVIRTKHREGTREFFEEIEKHRYEEQNFMYEVFQYDKYKGKKVLEIGCRLGTDASQFAKNGAIVTATDITKKAVEMTRKRFKLFGLKGKFLVADAEDLPFEDESFDVVYSFGTLHHIPNVEKALDEIYRVMKPNGEILIGVYNKYSMNFLKILFIHGILKGKLRKMNIERLISSSTEFSSDNPYTRLYTVKEIRNLLKKFVHINTYIRGIKFPFNFFERILGWYIIVKAKKPSIQMYKQHS